MDIIEWDDKFKIGVEVVDKAHAKLFRITKKLLELSTEAGANQSSFREGIKYLESYSMTHFSEEEAYMRSIRYGGYAQHKRIHDNFRDSTLVSLKKDLELSHYSPAAIQRFVATMNSWLKTHIMQEDQAIVGKAAVKKGYDFSSQIPIITKTINRAAQELFQAEIKLSNPDYKGQNIGNALYCRQDYETEGGVRLTLLLGVEDSLFIRGVNRFPEMQTVQKDAITPDAALLVFEQLYQRISKLFRIETEPEFTRENLLDKNQFRKEFMKGYPCSLLYNAKIGYLTFCYRSRRVKK